MPAPTSLPSSIQSGAPADPRAADAAARRGEARGGAARYRGGMTRSPSSSGESRAFAVTSALGGALAAVCVLVGVVMLLLKWAGFHPVPLVSQIPLLLLPVAFVLLMAALVIAVRRRRRS